MHLPTASALPIALALTLAAAFGATSAVAATRVQVELNNVETVNNQCRVTFVIDNRAKEPIESLKLDLAVFNKQQVVQRRLVTELGPLRGAKTIVKTFAIEGACGEIGSILVNDVTCAPAATPDACLDGLDLTSRLKDLRFFK
jgi:hypothetical protein